MWCLNKAELIWFERLLTPGIGYRDNTNNNLLHGMYLDIIARNEMLYKLLETMRTQSVPNDYIHLIEICRSRSKRRSFISANSLQSKLNVTIILIRGAMNNTFRTYTVPERLRRPWWSSPCVRRSHSLPHWSCCQPPSHRRPCHPTGSTSNHDSRQNTNMQNKQWWHDTW